METEEILIDVLVENEIILSGVEDKEQLKDTDHFKIMHYLAEEGAADSEKLNDIIGKSAVLILFELKGDGLVIEKDRTYDLHENIKKKL